MQEKFFRLCVSLPEGFMAGIFLFPIVWFETLIKMK